MEPFSKVVEDNCTYVNRTQSSDSLGSCGSDTTRIRIMQMADVMPEEVNVFYIPHLRMKQLVNVYLEQIRETDFTSNVALQALLQHLHDIFVEVKCHEDIEDNIILDRLQARLKTLCVDNIAVCDCHSNNHVGQMISLIDDGIAVRSRSSEDCVAFGMRLQEALNEFTSAFLPHMKQEEEVFQPLLVKYFEYNELQSIQELVIMQHCSLTNNLIYETMLSSMNLEYDELQTMKHWPEDGRRMAYEYIEHDLSSAVPQSVMLENVQAEIWNGMYAVQDCPDGHVDAGLFGSAVTPECAKRLTVMDIPDVAITKIFSYLDPPDLGRCAQVCWTWNSLVYQPCLWRTVCPVQWALGHWKYEKDWNTEQHRIPILQGQRPDSYLLQQVNTEDFPVSGLGIMESMESLILDQRDIRKDLLQRRIAECSVIFGLLQFVLWRVGSGVKELNLGSSCILNDLLLNLFMLQCPNVVHLDVSYTALSVSAFHGVKANGSCRLLTTVCFSGCENLEDSAIMSLTKCWENENEEFNDELIDRDMQKNVSSLLVTSTSMTEMPLIGISDQRNQPNTGRDGEGFWSIPYVQCQRRARVSGLRSLILSGCHKLTNKSLEELMRSNTFIRKLSLLDMSGCFQFTACMLNCLVKRCPILSPECLSYCDHIRGGPYSNEANGCNNLQSVKRACCIPPE